MNGWASVPLNFWALYHFPWDIYANNRFSWYSAQPTSEKCINNAPSGQRATERDGQDLRERNHPAPEHDSA